MKKNIINALLSNFVESNPVMDGEEILVVSKEIFGDSEEHEINFHYGNGLAISEDKQYVMTYPKREELSEEDKDYIREYDGIPNPRDYTNRDICLALGSSLKRL